MSKRALVVVDVQPDFCEGGALPVDGGNRVADRIADLLDSEHGYDVVVATRDHHIDPGAHFSETPDFVDSWPAHCVVGTPGVALHPALETRTMEAVFDKGEYEAAYSGFEGSCDGVKLGDWLRERSVDSVEIIGIATDYCVRATALDAAEAGFTTTVRLDLTAGVAASTVESTVADLRAAGVTLVGEPIVRA